MRNPLAQNLLNFDIEGPGLIIAAGSSDPRGTESFVQPMCKAYQGSCKACKMKVLLLFI
jgi:beta-galactosidase